MGIALNVHLGITGNIQDTKKVFNSTTGIVKNPGSVTTFPMPDCIIDLVNEWGHKYQKEKKKNKLKFLNYVQLQYNLDNNELKDNENLVTDNACEDITSQFSGIKLEQEMVGGVAATMTELEMFLDQEELKADDNSRLIEPTTETPSTTVGIIIDNSGAEDIAVLQECDHIKEGPIEQMHEEPDVVKEPEAQGMIHNELGQRHLVRLAMNRGEPGGWFHGGKCTVRPSA
jgi:hypothetical protein